MNINVDINYEPLVYWETIPADCFPFQDSNHHVFLTPPPSERWGHASPF